MNELSIGKWGELNAKLEAEKADAEAREKASTLMAGKLIVVALSLFALAGALLWILADTVYGLLSAMPPGLLFLITVMYVMRYRKLATLAHEDMERIQRDIRAWKKKKPA